jgi:amino acid transporter
MMQKVNGRTIAVASIVLIMGLFLLLLVLPSMSGNSLVLLSVLFSLIPVTFIALLLVYMFGKNPERSQSKGLPKRASKTLAGVATACIAGSVFLTWLSTKFSPWSAGTPKFILENIGVALLFLAFASVLLLFSGQQSAYFLFWSKDNRWHADERQKAVRNRVYEKSYRVVIALLVIVLWLYQIPSQRLQDELIQAMILCIFGVPAIIAAWQKDS